MHCSYLLSLYFRSFGLSIMETKHQWTEHFIFFIELFDVIFGLPCSEKGRGLKRSFSFKNTRYVQFQSCYMTCIHILTGIHLFVLIYLRRQ